MQCKSRTLAHSLSCGSTYHVALQVTLSDEFDECIRVGDRGEWGVLAEDRLEMLDGSDTGVSGAIVAQEALVACVELLELIELLLDVCW